VAFTRQGQQIGLVDANGVLLAMPAAMMAQHHYSFPVVTGIDAHDPPDARKARMAVYQRLLAELDSNGQRISEQISEIDLTNPADAQVLMPEQGADILAHFGEDRFLERYQRYKAGIHQWREQHPDLVAVDLRYDHQVVLSMPPGASVAKAAADEQVAANANDGKAADVEPPKTASSATGVQPPLTALAAADNAATGEPPVKPKSVKLAGKVGSKTSAKPKTALKTALKSSKDKARDKKRAEAKRAALNTSKQKAAPTNHPAASAGMGQ
jgi:cell division protein FtsQ